MSGSGRLEEARMRQAKHRRLACLIVAVLLTACSGHGHHQPNTGSSSAVAKQQPEKAIVTDANGMTVYVHDADAASKSRCNESCAESWAPVRPTSNFPLGGKFSVITRKDGTQQLAYDRRPLYTFKYDQMPGDKKGDGKQGEWHALYY